jgi:hypothetical protein
MSFRSPKLIYAYAQKYVRLRRQQARARESAAKRRDVYEEMLSEERERLLWLANLELADQLAAVRRQTESGPGTARPEPSPSCDDPRTSTGACEDGLAPEVVLPDGPHAGRLFAWKSRTCETLSPTEYRLLEALWSRRNQNTSESSMNHDEALDEVWAAHPKRAKPKVGKSVTRFVQRLEVKLNEEDIYVGLRSSGYTIYANFAER